MSRKPAYVSKPFIEVDLKRAGNQGVFYREFIEATEAIGTVSDPCIGSAFRRIMPGSLSSTIPMRIVSFFN